jgi:trypsin
MAPQMSLKAALLVPLAGMAVAAPAPAPADVGINIVGGTTASSGEFPYIVSLSRSSSHFCGGVLLNANTVVTAGHCSDYSASSVKVRAGSLVS